MVIYFEVEYRKETPLYLSFLNMTTPHSTNVRTNNIRLAIVAVITGSNIPSRSQSSPFQPHNGCPTGTCQRNTLLWRHNGHDGVPNHQPHDYLLYQSFRRMSKKHQISASLAFVWVIHRWPGKSSHKGPVTFTFDDVIMIPARTVVWVIYTRLRHWGHIETRCPPVGRRHFKLISWMRMFDFD